MQEHCAKARLIVITILFPLLTMPFLAGLHYLDHPVHSQPAVVTFAGKVILMVPPPDRGHAESEPNVSIERARQIGADGVMFHFDKWWENVELYEDAVRRYSDAGLLVVAEWEHHGGTPYHLLRFNPPIHYWALAHQEIQMTGFWRVCVNSSAPRVSAYGSGVSFVDSWNATRNPDGSISFKIRSLDYYVPVYGNGRVNVSSVYEEYPASEFSWLYDESGVTYDVEETPYEKGSRLAYGGDYEITIENNTMYATIFDHNNRDFNLYVLFYVPGFPSVYFSEGRNAWLDTLETFLSNFSKHLDALSVNSGGFPISSGDFHPEIIRNVEEKYDVEFSFDGWIFRPRAYYDWDLDTLVQYVFDRENHLIFAQYAEEKQDLLHKHDVIYVPTGSDMSGMLMAMIEHADALLVNTWSGWQHKVARYGDSGPSTAWTPSTIRLGTWENICIMTWTTKDEIMNWGTVAVDELLKWNPDGGAIVYWTGTASFTLNDEQWEALKELTQYMHSRFKHVAMIPAHAERYTVAKAYWLSYLYRYGPSVDLNPGQVDYYPLYVKDLNWDELPTDGCLVAEGQRSYVGASSIDDMEAHERIKQAVGNGASFAFSGFMIRRIEEYYGQTNPNIAEMMKNMVQAAAWVHDTAHNITSHYLTFDGTLDPRHLNDTPFNGHWLWLRANATASIIAGEYPVAGLYEADYGAGEILGFSPVYSPFRGYLTDETSATYGDEYLVRFLEYCGRKVGSFRLWDVGKTYVYRADGSTYYALFVERYGISRDVPVTVYGANNVRIIDMDTGQEIPNNSTIHLDSNSTKLLKITL